jgi:hypothetical protein
MNFLEITKRALARHGIDLVYASVTTGAYNVETGKPAVTRTEYTKRMYPKQIVANQYNYPALVGKESLMFYLANDALEFSPKANDEIEYKSKTYKVQSLQEHFAAGELVLYRIVAVRG